MRNILFIILLLGFQSNGFCQTKFDEFITITFPGEELALDTVMKGERLIGSYYNTESEAYSLMKLKIDNQENYLNQLPYDTKSLKKYYRSVLEGNSKQFAKRDLSLIDSSFVNIDNYIAFSALYGYSKVDTVANVNFLIIEENLYNINYLNSIDYQRTKFETFINSISVDKSKKHSQYSGNSKAAKQGYIFGKVVFWIMIFGLIIYAYRSFKTKKSY